MKISIVGAGYVGLCTGAAFAWQGHDVTLVDIDDDKVRRIMEGKAPFHEPGLEDILIQEVESGRLTATTDLLDAVCTTEATFICVGTPSADDGSVDLTYVRAAVHQVLQCANLKPNRHGIILKSTVIPGTLQSLVAREDLVWYASNPEFLREGSALQDALQPDRVVIGCDDLQGNRWLKRLYKDLDRPIVQVRPAEAEMAKYVANSFLATKVAFANEMANLAGVLGIDWYDVVRGFEHDPRISPLFLRPGVGFGGSCFPKDVAALHHLAQRKGTPSLLLSATLEQNAIQPFVAVRMLAEELGDLDGKRIAVLGLAFKPDTDDVRESRARPIVEALMAAGADVVCYDPEAGFNFLRLCPDAKITVSPDAALRGAHGCIIQTEWEEFKQILPEDFLTLMETPVVIDGRRTYHPAAMQAHGIHYRTIGRGALRRTTHHATPANEQVVAS